MGRTHGNIVILGAGYAGLSCAFRLAAKQPRARITVVDARETFCERIRLHQVAVGQATRRPQLAPWLAGAGIEFEQARVLSIDANERAILTSQGELRYEHLVVALGSRPRAEVPGVALHAHSIASEDGALELARTLARLSSGSRVVIVGAGLTGIELAAEVAEARPDLSVELVSGAKMGGDANGARLLASSALEKLRRTLAALAVRVHEGREVSRVEAGCLVATPQSLSFDVCVWTAGFEASSIAQQSGLPTSNRGRLAVDAMLRVPSHPQIYGAGDAAEPIEDVGAPALMSCRLGMPAGLHAAENLAHELSGTPLEAWRIRDVLRCVSLGRAAGIVQFHHRDGALRELSLSGKPAAWLKEKICAGTLWALEREAKKASRARGLRELPSSDMAYVT